MSDRAYCPDCKRDITLIEGVTAICDRGEWWCLHCVKILRYVDGLPVVDFPSPGKLQPLSILTWYEEKERYA